LVAHALHKEGGGGAGAIRAATRKGKGVVSSRRGVSREGRGGKGYHAPFFTIQHAERRKKKRKKKEFWRGTPILTEKKSLWEGR